MLNPHAGVREMVVGHVRQELDWEDRDELDCDEDVISLTLFQPIIDRNKVYHHNF